MKTNIGIWAVVCSPRSGHLDPSAVVLNVSAGVPCGFRARPSVPVACSDQGSSHPALADPQFHPRFA